jgi:hypothetical protein
MLPERDAIAAIGAVALAMTVEALELTSDAIFQGARDFLPEPRPGRRDHQHPQLCPGRAQRAAGSRRAEVDLSIELQILAFHAQRRAVVRVALGEGAPVNGSSGVTQAAAT